MSERGPRPDRAAIELAIRIDDDERIIWAVFDGYGEGFAGDFDGYRACWAPAEAGEPTEDPTWLPMKWGWKDAEAALLTGVKYALRDMWETQADRMADAAEQRACR